MIRYSVEFKNTLNVKLKVSILKEGPETLTHCISECFLNTVNEVIASNPQTKKSLKKHREIVEKLVSAQKNKDKKGKKEEAKNENY